MIVCWWSSRWDTKHTLLRAIITQCEKQATASGFAIRGGRMTVNRNDGGWRCVTCAIG